MARKRRLGVEDITGTWAIMPTPAKENASDWRVENTLDLDEAARIAENLVKAGVNGILSLGTYGEGATLTWEEKRLFMATVVETVKGRIPYFGGTTSLNTRESVRQTRAALDMGVDGTMLGPPMWCKPDLPTAVQFYRDVAEACPEMAICIYANTEAFKFEFSRPFWAQMAEIPQVVSSKYLGLDHLLTDIRLTKGRIRLLTTDKNYFAGARMAPDDCKAFWSGGALCGPMLANRLRDEVIAAKKTGDWSKAKTVSEQISLSLSTLFPKGEFSEFSKYNIGLEKARMNAAGWIKAGPCRPPYHLVPPEYLKGAEESGRQWAKYCALYDKPEAA